jgi:hypothetical protein
MVVGYNCEYVVMRTEDAMACLEVLFENHSYHCLSTVMLQVIVFMVNENNVH